MLGWMTITAVVGVVVETILRRELDRDGAAAREPSCGRCGYIVTGLPSHVCPECGSDLRTVGVVR
jgi:hypothetical protein